MKEWLQNILDNIASDKLLPVAYLEELDCDSALDARDQPGEFDDAWQRVSEEVGRRFEEASISLELFELAEAIRKESFLKVSRATRQHEIASYISDDFEILVRGRLLGVTDPFLDQLWNAYEQGKFPFPATRGEN